MINNIHKRNKRKNIRRFLILSVFLLAFFVSVFPCRRVIAAPSSSVYFNPSSAILNSGDSVSLETRIDPSSNSVVGIDVEVSYDPNVIHVTSIARNSADFKFELKNSIDNNAGRAFISVATDVSAAPPVLTGDTLAATFIFQAVGSGDTVIFFGDKTYVGDVNESGNVVSTKTPAQISISAKAYTVTDFAKLVADWLQTKISEADVNSDGMVNSRDLGVMMSHWTD